MDERDEAIRSLVGAVAALGYPPEFGDLLLRELRFAPAIRRMAGYLWNVRPSSMEDIADELLAIREETDCWIEQKRSEHANAQITAFYNRTRD